jgi:hypothetical protein
MNFNLILKGRNEFYPGLNSKTYYILKVDTPEKIHWTENLLIKFISNAKSSNQKYYLGIDFEFNKVGKTNRDIALMQINLESDDTQDSYVIILYPPEFQDASLQILKNLLSEPKIIKILHGAESLDIPYMFSQLLISSNLINGLCENFYDTKFLCDYAHIVEKKKASCSIYHLLIENNVITQKKFNELEGIELITGPIYTITIDIHSMSNDILRYSLYDVLYLPDLIKKYISKGIVYEKIIPETTILMYKYRRDVESEFSNLEKIIVRLNNNFIYDHNNEITLHDIWECYYYFISDKKKYLMNLKEIQSLKKFFEVITKMIIYSHVLNLFTVYKSKQEKNHMGQNYFNQYFEWIKRYPTLNTLFQEYSNIVHKDLKKIIDTL